MLVLWLVLWLRLLRLWLLRLWLLPLLGRWPWPVLPVGSGDEGIRRLGLSHWLALLLRLLVIFFYIGSPTASPYLRPRRASRVCGVG